MMCTFKRSGDTRPDKENSTNDTRVLMQFFTVSRKYRIGIVQHDIIIIIISLFYIILQ